MKPTAHRLEVAALVFIQVRDQRGDICLAFRWTEDQKQTGKNFPPPLLIQVLSATSSGSFLLSLLKKHLRSSLHFSSQIYRRSSYISF